MISIALPEKYGRFTKEDYVNIRSELKGVYLFFNAADELLYVGKTENVKNRVRNHWFGETNTESFYNDFAYVDVYEVDCAVERDLYETFFINHTDTTKNIGKKFRNSTSADVKNPESKRKRIDFILGEDDLSRFSEFDSIDELKQEIIRYEAVINYSDLGPSWKRKLTKMCEVLLRLSEYPYGVIAVSQAELSNLLGVKKADTVGFWLKMLEEEFSMVELVPTIRRSTMTQDVNLTVIKKMKLVSRESLW